MIESQTEKFELILKKLPNFFLFTFSASRLTLGHVNEFGVFCSGMEEQPLDEKHQDSSGKNITD